MKECKRYRTAGVQEVQECWSVGLHAVQKEYKSTGVHTYTKYSSGGVQSTASMTRISCIRRVLSMT